MDQRISVLYRSCLSKNHWLMGATGTEFRVYTRFYYTDPGSYWPEDLEYWGREKVGELSERDATRYVKRLYEYFFEGGTDP